MSKQYAERDAMALDEAGGYYMRHVMAMTGEKLHGKGDIAAELGWRDMQIADLQQKLEASEALMLAMRDDSRESRSKLELVVAENVTMKESRKRLGEFILEEIDADYPLNMDVKTPATDAMVNEIRAEGIEAWISSRNGGWNGTTKQAEDFASQLRTDAAKGGSDD
ncbi:MULTISPECIES: hypothetical protein [unclassified Pantoea]|uniref:hypothetical protein n=1 Tax=unclassified Pantoea TaxID=2630326 RepID=UPI001CD69F93|nr:MULTISPECIES: hypothetical protein [unclassified Pantoea]MCA1178918.1 hypothetical protein [Pantoea sp. alder69]MCA1253630.1 hypothetical protein [Pantoea sp. alder70]MCA1267407.1 hypothetical protein [Pantoea sp. alder81]